jgi:hypothetical protein
VAALNLGAVPELIDEGVSGVIFESVDDMSVGLPRVCALDRRRVRAIAADKFGIERMVGAHVAAYRAILAGRAAAVGGR